ncbi:unnamed protein product [Lactuca saligna]|uniref:Agenet domain-containing protein n=1 Tax=Lactuca saligna TaxID=75948 RepID=A0AA36E0Y6_LACSI|nr:unnamed protein product [Lactuca saligna]
MDSQNEWNNKNNRKLEVSNAAEKQKIKDMWIVLPKEENETYGQTNGPRTRIQCSDTEFVNTWKELGEDRCTILRTNLKDSPFQSLLELDGGVRNSDLILDLVSIFNVSNKSLNINGHDYRVTPEEFTNIMGIKDGVEEIDLKNHPSKELNTLFADSNPCQFTVSNKKIAVHLKSNDMNIATKAYALLSLLRIVCAPGRGSLNGKYLNNIDDMNHKRWATHAIETLVQSIASFQNGKGLKQKYLGGCVLFLQLFYMNKASMNPKKDVPLLQYFKKNVVDTFLKEHKKCTAGLLFTVGKRVEVRIKVGNLKVWFPATVVGNLGNTSFLVEHQQPGIGDEATCHKVTVDYQYIRPSPPHLSLKDMDFVLLEKVDAYYDFGWWRGVVTKKLADNRYNVFFKHTKREIEFDCSSVRPRMKWKRGKWFTTFQGPGECNSVKGETDGRTTQSKQLEQTTPKQSTTATSLPKRTNQTDLDSNDKNSLPSRRLENEIRSDDPSLLSQNTNGQSEGLDTECSIRGKGVELKTPTMDSSRKKGRLETELIGEGAEDNPAKTRIQENVEKYVTQCNGMTVSQEKKLKQLINVAEGETKQASPCVGFAPLTVVDKEGKEGEEEAEIVSPTPTPKRKRGRPPKLQAISPVTPVSAAAGVAVNDHDHENNENVKVQAHRQEGKVYSSMRGKGGKRRVISIDSESPPSGGTKGEEGLGFGDNLPFKISSPTLWKTIESMDVLRKIPQKPHFRALEGVKESEREGVAIGSMVTFSRVVDKTCALRFEDPRSAIEECLETVAELELHGFQVELVRERLTQLLLIKEKQEEEDLQQQRLKGITQKMEEAQMEGNRLDSEIDEIDRGIRDLEKRRRRLLSNKEKHDSQMGLIKAVGDRLHKHLTEVGLDFHCLAAAPFLPSGIIMND